MATEVRLSRELKLLDITMIGVGAMIGAGIFVLTGIAAGVAGPGLLVAFFLNGLVAMLTAMAYAELGSAFHDAGGGYLWVKTSLPDPNGFLSGWMSWFAHAVACSLYALGFGAYFRLLLETAGVPPIHLGFMSLEKWLAVLTTVVFSYINFRGASEAGKAGNVVTVGKIVIIGAFIAVGIWVLGGRPDWKVQFEPFLTQGWGGVFAAMGLTFIAFEGYEIIAQTSEEVENPKRNVPRAIFLSLAIVIPIYLLVAFVAIGAVTPPAGMTVTAYLGAEKEVALVRAADQFLVGGGFVILIGGLLSTLSALNATVYSSSRVAFAMARDANLPEMMGAVHPKTATPHLAILFSSLIVIGMAVLLPIEDVAAAADIMFLLLFVQVNVAVMRLRKKRPELDRGFHIPFMPLVPILAIGSMLFLAVFLFTHYPMAWVAAGGWIAVGAGVYYGYSRHREAAHLKREAWMERIERMDYRVLVSVANPKTATSLVELGAGLARRRRGDLIVMSVAEVPDGEALLRGRHIVPKLEPVLNAAVAHAKTRGVTARQVVEIARRVSHGIAETAREEECNFLVIGRPVAHSFVERMVSSIVERVLQDAPCQVGIVYGEIEAHGVGRIVLPVTKGRNPQLAAELAPGLGEWFGAEVHPVTVIPEGMSDAEADRQVADAKETLAEAGLDGALEVLRRREVGKGLARMLRRDDLVLIGAPSTHPLAALVGGTLPDELASRRRVPVVVVRDVEERRARRFEFAFFGREKR